MLLLETPPSPTFLLTWPHFQNQQEHTGSFWNLDSLFCHWPNSQLLKGWCDEINPTWVINLLRNSRSTDKFLL